MKVGLFSRPTACSGAFFLPEKTAESMNLYDIAAERQMLSGNIKRSKLKIS